MERPLWSTTMARRSSRADRGQLNHYHHGRYQTLSVCMHLLHSLRATPLK